MNAGDCIDMERTADIFSIPKVIHYCWFGGKPLGELEQKCIASWERFLPEYEIKRWDETNYDVQANDYLRQTYQQGKWAFLSDYVRFDVLNRCGGIYLDTDVEIIKPIDDILAAGAFVACETDGPMDPKMRSAKGKRVSSGLGMALPKAHYLSQKILEAYNNLNLDRSNGKDAFPITADVVTPLMVELGLKDGNHVMQLPQLAVYPSEFFNPKSFDTGELLLTENTRAIHHFAMSWHTKSEAFEYELRKTLLRRGLSYGASSILSTAAEILRFADFSRVVNKLTRDK